MGKLRLPDMIRLLKIIRVEKNMEESTCAHIFEGSMKKKRKIIFLDIDGVICTQKELKSKFRYPDTYEGFNDACLRRIEHIVQETGAEIVISSDWKMIR